MEIRVQRGVKVFSGLSDTAALSPSVSTSRSFAHLQSAPRMSGGPDAGTITTKNYRDVSGAVKITSASQLTFTRPTNAEAINYRFNWELWEYVGAVGGPHEFIVRAQADAFLGAFDTLIDVTIPGISDITKVVPIICGVQSGHVGDLPTSNICQIQRLGTNQIRIRRLTSGLGREILLTYAVVEFVGSSWKIQEVVHGFSASGVDESETITPVSAWSKACLFNSNIARGDGDRSVQNTVRPGATTSTVRFRLPSGATAVGHSCYAYVVENDQLAVQHLDSITGGRSPHNGGFPAPFTFDESITALPDLAQAAALATHDTSLNGINLPSTHWGWRLLNTTTLRFENTKNNVVGDWTAQAIDFSQMTPTTGIEANPQPVAATAAIPAVAAEPGPVTASPAPVTAQGATPVSAAVPGAISANPAAVAAQGAVPMPSASVGLVANMQIVSATGAVPAPTGVPGATAANPLAVTAQGAVPSPSVTGVLFANLLPVAAAAAIPVPGAVPGNVNANPPPVRALAFVPLITTQEPEGLALEVESLLRIEENVDSLGFIQADVETLASEIDSVDSFQSVDLEVESPSALSSDVTALGESNG